MELREIDHRQVDDPLIEKALPNLAKNYEVNLAPWGLWYGLLKAEEVITDDETKNLQAIRE